MNLVKSLLIGYVRHVLTALAGYLFAHGLVQQSDEQVLVSAGLAVAGVAWSSINKVMQSRELSLARMAAVAGVAAPIRPGPAGKP